MREAALHLAFAGLGAEEALSGAFEDNAASLATSRAVGYEENGEARGPRRDGAGRTIRFRMSREGWEHHRRNDIEITGLEDCLDMFTCSRANTDPVTTPGEAPRGRPGARQPRRGQRYPTTLRPNLCDRPWAPTGQAHRCAVTYRSARESASPSASWPRAPPSTASLLRVWLLVHLPVWGDEAIVGLMAKSIDNGHFSAFYWGQHYGGLEPYVVAAALKVGGGGEPALNAAPAVLAALAAVLVGGITVAAGKDRLRAAAAARRVGVALRGRLAVGAGRGIPRGHAVLRAHRPAVLCPGLPAPGGPAWTFLLLGHRPRPRLVGLPRDRRISCRPAWCWWSGGGRPVRPPSRRRSPGAAASPTGGGRSDWSRGAIVGSPALVVRQRPHRLRLLAAELASSERRHDLRDEAVRLLPRHAAAAARASYG